MIRAETGRMNAFKFIEHVNAVSKEHRHVVVDSVGKKKPWPWMDNPQWRALVMEQLPHRATVAPGFRFYAPDSMHGSWTFAAVSTAGESKVRRLELDSTIDGTAGGWRITIGRPGWMNRLWRRGHEEA